MVPSCIAALVSVMAGSPPPEPAGGWRSPAARCEAMAASLDIAPAPRPVVAAFNGERVVGRPWPAAEGHVTVLELTY